MIKAIYGKVKLNRHSCPSCNNPLLNTSRIYICDVCGYGNKDDKAKTFKVVVPPPGIRKVPPRFVQRMILESQGGKCFWCSNKFDTPYWKNNKVSYLKIHWDHKVPFSYSLTNKDDNWAASCNLCNLFKSNFLFKNEKECRHYLLKRWQIAIDKNEISR